MRRSNLKDVRICHTFCKKMRFFIKRHAPVTRNPAEMYNRSVERGSLYFVMQSQNDSGRYNVDQLKSGKHRQAICDDGKGLRQENQFISAVPMAMASDLKIESTWLFLYVNWSAGEQPPIAVILEDLDASMEITSYESENIWINSENSGTMILTSISVLWKGSSVRWHWTASGFNGKWNW